MMHNVALVLLGTVIGLLLFILVAVGYFRRMGAAWATGVVMGLLRSGNADIYCKRCGARDVHIDLTLEKEETA